MKRIFIIIPVLLLLYTGYCIAQTEDFLDLNNIKARINAHGNHFRDSAGNATGFEVPASSGKNTIKSFDLWIGGFDPNVFLHLAADRMWSDTTHDFMPGPVSNAYDSAYQSIWYKVWKLNKSDIIYHMNNWQDTLTYQPIENIAIWPGNGNTSLGQTAQIAPYFDYNQDGLYNPADGDYPIIYGDQAIFFIYNDAFGTHTNSGGICLKAEIKGMAYAFDDPSDTLLFNTIFFHYDITNRALVPYPELRLGLYADFDIGDPTDDYIGSDVQNGAFYGYNGDNVDGTGQPSEYGICPPAQAIQVLGGPLMPPDTLDNPAGLCDFGVTGFDFENDTVDDEQLGLTGFINFINTSSNPCGIPDQAIHYYNYMSSIWKDGTDLYYDGTGHYSDPSTSDISAKFFFPCNSDPLGWGTGCDPQAGWDEITESNPPGNRMGSTGNVGPFSLVVGETKSLDLAFVFAHDTVSPCNSVSLLEQMLSSLKTRVINHTLNLHLPAFYGISENNYHEGDFSVYPNPSSGKFLVKITDLVNSSAMLQIINITGQTVYEAKISGSETSLELGGLPKGIYFVHLNNERFTGVKKLIIQ